MRSGFYLFSLPERNEVVRVPLNMYVSNTRTKAPQIRSQTGTIPPTPSPKNLITEADTPKSEYTLRSFPLLCGSPPIVVCVSFGPNHELYTLADFRGRYSGFVWITESHVDRHHRAPSQSAGILANFNSHRARLAPRRCHCLR